jgi:hypothetical protein
MGARDRPPTEPRRPPGASEPSERIDGAEPLRRHRRIAAVLTTAAGCLAIVAAVTVALTSSSSEDGKPLAERADRATPAAGPLDPDAAPADAFAHAAARLEEAGTFAYEASSRVEGPDPTGGPGILAADRQLAGEVVLPDAVRETIEQPDGLLSERIATPSASWGRDTAFPDQIDERPWGQFDPPSGELEMYLLPEWLAGAVDHRDGGEDANGRRVVVATVPSRLISDLGPEMNVIDAQVELTLDAEGDPYGVDLTVSTTDTVIEASYRLTDLGGDIAVEPPPADELDATPWFNEQDLERYDGPQPLGLSGIPAGWELASAYVTPDPTNGCASATVDYTDLEDPVGSYLWLDVFDAECAIEPTGEPLDVAGFVGGVEDFGDGSRGGTVISGEVAVSFTTDLSVADLRLVLATLGPLDLVATPEQLAGVPASPT